MLRKSCISQQPQQKYFVLTGPHFSFKSQNFFELLPTEIGVYLKILIKAPKLS